MTEPTQPAAPVDDVSQFGYKAEMKRELGPFQSFAMAFGFVSIATGTFTSYSAMLGTSGPMGVWTWLIVIIGQLMVALIFGGLAARIPVSGYSYQWVSRLANPVLGWIMGWVTFTFLAIVVLAVDYTIASAILPNLFGYAGTNLNALIITAVVVASQSGLVMWSTHYTQRLNSIAVIIQIIGIGSVVVLLYAVGFFKGAFDWSMVFNTGAIPREGYFGFGSLTHAGPFIMGTLAGAFTIVGFESAANMAEETRDAVHVIPKAMRQAVIALGVIGFAFVLGATALIKDPIALADSPTALADIITTALGPVAGKALLVLIVISIYSCGLTITVSGSRQVWAMARDERFPGWQWLRKVNRATNTPMNAALFMMIVSEAILLAFGFSTGVLFAFFSAATLLPAMIYAGTTLLYIVKRRQLPPTDGFKLGRWELPVLSVASVWLIYELLIFRDASFASVWLYIAIFFLIGGLYLAYLFLKRGSRGLDMPELSDIDQELDKLGQQA